MSSAHGRGRPMLGEAIGDRCLVLAAKLIGNAIGGLTD
jgi:hypothetical protein